MPPRKLSSLEAWLVRVDPSGSLNRYLPQLQATFDCAEQVVDAYVRVDAKAGRRRLDERIFEDLGVQDPADQRRFEAWFMRETGIEPLAPPLQPAGGTVPGILKPVSRSGGSSSGNRGATSHEAWLSCVDSSGGLSVYLPVLREHFDCAEQVIEAYAEVVEQTGQVVLDPEIFTDLGVSSAKHQRALAEWFAEASGGIEELVSRCRGERPGRPPQPSKPGANGAVRWADRQVDMSDTTAGTAPSETTANSADDAIDPAALPAPPTVPAKPSRLGMTPREEALRPWCAVAGIPEEVLQRLRNEDVWCPEDLTHLDKQDLADIVKDMKKGVQGRFYSAVHRLRKAKGLVPGTPRLEGPSSCSPGSDGSAECAYRDYGP